MPHFAKVGYLLRKQTNNEIGTLEMAEAVFDCSGQ